MADHEWLRNLANARFVSGAWTLENEDEVRTLLLARLEESILILEEEAKEAAQIYNQHVRGEHKIAVMPLEATALSEGARAGFMLLLKDVQVFCELGQKGILLLRAFTTRGFSRKSRFTAKLKAQADSFGSILWQGENGLLLSSEMIIKRLLEELAKLATTE